MDARHTWIRLILALPLACAACTSAPLPTSEPAPKTTIPTTAAVLASTSTSTTPPERPAITDDHLRAALLRSGDLDGEWSEDFWTDTEECVGGIEAAGLGGRYVLVGHDAGFSIRFFRFASDDTPRTTGDAATQWLRDCRGFRADAEHTLYESGRVVADELDFAPSSTFVTLHDDIYIVAEFSRPTVEAQPKTILPKVVARLEEARLRLPEDLPQAAPWTPREPDYTPRSGGCFGGPAWPGEFVEISSTASDPADPHGDTVDADLDGDGTADRLVVHENGDLQVDLGNAGWTTLLTTYTSYELAGGADLDGDGDDELLLQRNGNNFGGIEIADVSDCTLQLALSTADDDTAFYGNWCSSNSCFGILKRTDCILDDSGSFIRHHVMAVPDRQLDDWRSGLIDTAQWDYTVTDHRLVNGVMTTVVVQETTQLTETEAFAILDNADLGTDCRAL